MKKSQDNYVGKSEGGAFTLMWGCNTDQDGKSKTEQNSEAVFSGRVEEEKGQSNSFQAVWRQSDTSG